MAAIGIPPRRWPHLQQPHHHTHCRVVGALLRQRLVQQGVQHLGAGGQVGKGTGGGRRKGHNSLPVDLWECHGVERDGHREDTGSALRKVPPWLRCRCHLEQQKQKREVVCRPAARSWVGRVPRGLLTSSRALNLSSRVPSRSMVVVCRS